VERFREAAARNKARSPLGTKRGNLLVMENRNRAIDFLNAATNAGLPLAVVADLIGISGRTLWRSGLTSGGRSLVSIAVSELQGKWPTSSPLKSGGK